ncbi:MAG: trigger factor [Clostridium sp.]
MGSDFQTGNLHRAGWQGPIFIYVATVATKPEVTLGEYKGIEVEKAKPEVTDADVEAELKKVQEQNSRLVSVEDRAVADGDQTVDRLRRHMQPQGIRGRKELRTTL